MSETPSRAMLFAVAAVVAAVVGSATAFLVIQRLPPPAAPGPGTPPRPSSTPRRRTPNSGRG